MKNTEKLIALLEDQKLEINKYCTNSDMIMHISAKHFYQIKDLLNDYFFIGKLKYKEDQFLNEMYLINQFKDFILNIKKFGINTKTKFIKNIKAPCIMFRFSGSMYAPSIKVENTYIETFPNNISMFYYVIGYNQLSWNIEYSKHEKI